MLRPLFPLRAPSLVRGCRWLTLAALLVSCRSPTEVELVLSTDVPCTSFKGAAIFVSSSQEGAESSAPSTVAYGCQDSGDLGSLVVIPAGDKDQPLFVRIVEGVDLDATRCTEDDPEHHCIVTRRRLSFLPHEHLTLPISLDIDCRGLICGQTQACQKGRCIDATIDPEACGSAPCTLPALDGLGGQGGAGTGGSGGQSGLSGSSGQSGQGGLAGQGGLSGQGGLAGQGGMSGGSGQPGAGDGGQGGDGGQSGSAGAAGQGGAGGLSVAGQGGSGGVAGGGGKGLGGSSVNGIGGSSLCGAEVTACGPFTVCKGDCCGDDYSCLNSGSHDLYRCVGTTWTQVGSHCPEACPDAGSDCETSYCATEGETRCPPETLNATQMQVCQNHQWTTVACPAGLECYTGLQRCACDTPGAKLAKVSKDGLQQCYTVTPNDGLPATYFQSCASGKWGAALTCITGSCDPEQDLGGPCSIGEL